MRVPLDVRLTDAGIDQGSCVNLAVYTATRPKAPSSKWRMRQHASPVKIDQE